MNYYMAEQIKQGKAIDVSGFEKTPEGYYIISNFIYDDKDYCDSKLEKWIWSIAIHNSTKEHHASLDVDLCRNPDYTCVWLR